MDENLKEYFTEKELSLLKDALKDITENSDNDVDTLNLLENSWKINWKIKPPTPEEFLTEEWIGDTANTLFPYLKETFIEYFRPRKNGEEEKRYLMMYYFIGAGKTTLTVLVKVYMGVIFCLLKDPIKFFNKSKTTTFVDMSISFSKLQANDLLIKPMKQLLLTSPRFKRCKFRDEFQDKMNNGNPNFIYWNTCNDDGASLCQIGQLSYLTASEPSQLLGLNIISGSVTEMTFLIEVMSSEKVMRLWHDLDKRITSRFAMDNPYAKLIMDSSPNSLMSPADQYIEKHKNDKNVIFRGGDKWSHQPDLFPIWQKDPDNPANNFYVFCGTAEQPPKIIEETEINDYPKERIKKCPIDIREAMEEDISKTIRDWCGVPLAGVDNALIKNHRLIENCFCDFLDNELMWDRLPSNEMPEHMIWNKIKDKYFYHRSGNQYELKRNSHAERFYSVDLSEKHDMATCTLLHMEVDKDGNKMYIVDFTFVALASPEIQINIDAFKFLAKDLRQYGCVNLKHVSFDGFQSSECIQWCNREGFITEKISVDTEIDYYLSMASYVYQCRLKMGRSLVVKNNMKSLIKGNTRNGKEVNKLTVDHLQGDFYDLENTDWETSMCGFYGKDATDSLTQAITLCDLYGSWDSQYIWDEEKEVVYNNKSVVEILADDDWYILEE